MEELKYGIINFNYSKKHQPILNSSLDIELSYIKSDKSYVVQAADLIAGTIRNYNLKYKNDIKELKKYTDFVDYLLYLP